MKENVIFKTSYGLWPTLFRGVFIILIALSLFYFSVDSVKTYFVVGILFLLGSIIPSHKVVLYDNKICVLIYYVFGILPTKNLFYYSEIFEVEVEDTEFEFDLDFIFSYTGKKLAIWFDSERVKRFEGISLPFNEIKQVKMIINEKIQRG